MWQIVLHLYLFQIILHPVYINHVYYNTPSRTVVTHAIVIDCALQIFCDVQIPSWSATKNCLLHLCSIPPYYFTYFFARKTLVEISFVTVVVQYAQVWCGGVEFCVDFVKMQQKCTCRIQTDKCKSILNYVRTELRLGYGKY